LYWFFSSYGFAFGLFLDTSRLIEEACAPSPLGHPSRPCPGLMYTIYFLIAYLNSQDGPEYVAQIVLQVGLMLSSTPGQTHPKTLVHAIQAQVLLANYFFLEHRTLEGKYHLGMAVSLVSSVGLYASARVEDEEKVNAFWMVYSMYSVWDPPCGAVEERKIDVPWPMDDLQVGSSSSLFSTTIPTCKTQIRIPGSWVVQPTVIRFLSGGTQAGPSRSLTEMYSKACILFSRATRIASAAASIESKFKFDLFHGLQSLIVVLLPIAMSSSSKQQLVEARNHLDALIDNFTTHLPPVAAQGSEVQTVVLIHTLTYASTIQLASTDVDAHPSIKSLAVARAAIDLLQVFEQILVINPIFGILWGIIGRVLVNEIRRLCQSGPRAGRNQLVETERTLDLLLTTIQGFTRGSSFSGLSFFLMLAVVPESNHFSSE
ncbi:hypothetical protein V5O48_017093, partial [Marasmius crinis-equi]